MFESRISTSTGRMSPFASFAPVRIAANAINLASSAITSMSTSIAMSKVGLGGIFVAVAVTALGSLGCGRLMDALLEEEPPIPQAPVDSGLDVVNVDGEAGLPDGDAGLDGDALINPDVIDAAEAEADVIIPPDAPDANEADAPINPDVIEAEAGDGDANPVDVLEGGDVIKDGDVIQPDGDSGPVCVPVNVTYNNFGPATGIYTNTVAVSGAIQLQEDDTKWTGVYDASLGFLPDDNNTVPKWTKNGSFVAPSPDVSTGSLYLNTLGSNVAGYYSINTNFDNSVGYAIDINLKINGVDNSTWPDTQGFVLTFSDGAKRAAFTFYTDRICEPLISQNCYVVPGGATNYRSYRITAKGTDYKVLVDNILGLDGTGYLLSGAGGLNYIYYGDMDSNPDSSVNVKYVKWNTAGNFPPYKTSGAYIHNSTVDSTFDNFDWTGIFAGWTNTGAVTASLAIRTGNTPADLSTASFSSEFMAPGAIPSGYTGKLLEWRLTENSNPDTPVVPEVSFKKDCADQ